ncbi:hypothetical protein VNO77_18524 [Canavalia gladiata]|uniref:Uncharacterized protein n=1 Tax=Canavalia gladiata TaxID=3824 RepID=A0AAN9LKZ8_CANGL
MYRQANHCVDVLGKKGCAVDDVETSPADPHWVNSIVLAAQLGVNLLWDLFLFGPKMIVEEAAFSRGTHCTGLQIASTQPEKTTRVLVRDDGENVSKIQFKFQPFI